MCPLADRKQEKKLTLSKHYVMSIVIYVSSLVTGHDFAFIYFFGSCFYSNMYEADLHI